MTATTRGDKPTDRARARLFEPGSVTRWHYRDADVPVGASNDHVAWVRSPETVVDRVETWWAGRST